MVNARNRRAELDKLKAIKESADKRYIDALKLNKRLEDGAGRDVLLGVLEYYYHKACTKATSIQQFLRCISCRLNTTILENYPRVTIKTFLFAAGLVVLLVSMLWTLPTPNIEHNNETPQYFYAVPASHLQRYQKQEQRCKKCGFANIANSMVDGETFEIEGEKLNRQQLYIKALHIDPRDGYIWAQLCNTLDDGPAFVNGNEITRRACIANSITEITASPDKGDAAIVLERQWGVLGMLLRSKKKTSVMVGGVLVTDTGCFVKVLEYNATNSYFWVLLGRSLIPTTDVEVNGETINQRGAYFRALEIDPEFGYAWYSLAYTEVVPSTEVVMGGGGNRMDVMTKIQCLIRAVEVPRDHQRKYMYTTTDQDRCKAWLGLGTTISPNDFVEVNGETVSQKQCYINLLKELCVILQDVQDLASLTPTMKESLMRITDEGWYGIIVNLVTTIVSEGSSSSRENFITSRVEDRTTTTPVSVAELGKYDAFVWLQKGKRLNPTATVDTAAVVQAGGIMKSITWIECFIRALELA